MDIIDQVQRVLQLGWPGIVLILMLAVAYVYYINNKERIAYLEKELDHCQEKVDAMAKQEEIRQLPN